MRPSRCQTGRSSPYGRGLGSHPPGSPHHRVSVSPRRGASRSALPHGSRLVTLVGLECLGAAIGTALDEIRALAEHGRLARRNGLPWGLGAVNAEQLFVPTVVEQVLVPLCGRRNGASTVLGDANHERILDLCVRGIFKKCVNSQAVYLLSEQHGLEAQERR